MIVLPRASHLGVEKKFFCLLARLTVQGLYVKSTSEKVNFVTDLCQAELYSIHGQNNFALEMNNTELKATLIGMQERQRCQAIRENWQTVLSEQFVAYIENQVNQIDYGVIGRYLGLPMSMRETLLSANQPHKAQIVALRDSMYAVRAQLIKAKGHSNYIQP